MSGHLVTHQWPMCCLRWRLLVVWCMVTWCIGGVVTFNLDTHTAVVYRSPASAEDGDWFGFSVASYIDRHSNWILVGAPRASTSQPGVTRPGAIYRCPADLTHYHASGDDLSSTCQQIPVDTSGNEVRHGREFEDKSYQWLGASVVAVSARDNHSSAVLACAPRYVWFSELGNSSMRREPIGTCYLATAAMSNFTEVSPCRTSAFSFRRQGSCQVGLGTAISADAERIMIGAAGSWTWQGQLYSLDVSSVMRSQLQSTRGMTGRRVDTSSNVSNNNIRTSEGPASDDSSYLGLAVAVGDFSGLQPAHDVVVGAPRGSLHLSGKVVIYDRRLRILHNISGQQIGAGFGHSVAVCDVNGDQLDDIIVGSPFYSKFDSDKFDTGRITVSYQNSQHMFERIQHIDGELSMAQFGWSVASLGDIDLDGYQDVAVGAPHAHTDTADTGGGAGAVYIFLGHQRGLSQQHSQVIFGSDVGIRAGSFGFSLSGQTDLDRNAYPDLVVGAYDSAAVTYLRARPVVRVNSSLKFSGVSSAMWDLDDVARTCELRDGLRVPCVTAKFCLQYSGAGVKRRTEFLVEVLCDVGHSHSPRMFLLGESSGGRRVSSSSVLMKAVRDRSACRVFRLFVDKDSLRDKLTPLTLQIKYRLSQPTSSPPARWHVRRRRRHLPPVLAGGEEEANTSASLNILQDCGEDNLCVPDLIMQLRPSKTEYLLGSEERLSMEITVLNALEDAFESQLFLTIPPGVDYVGTTKCNDSSQLPVLCTLRSGNSQLIVCDLGNPLHNSWMVHFYIHLMPRRDAPLPPSDGDERYYSFSATVNSTNEEPVFRRHDNQLTILVALRVYATLQAYGLSVPEVVGANRSDEGPATSADDVTDRRYPEVRHVYELYNSGPSDILAASVVIVWPTLTKHGDHLLYLMQQPQVEGPMRCDHVTNVNPQQLKVELDSLWSSSTLTSRSARRRGHRVTRQLAQFPVNCGPTRCSSIHCHLTGPLRASQNIIVHIHSMLWLPTITQFFNDTHTDDLSISSRMLVQVSQLSHGVVPSQHTGFTVKEVRVLVQSEQPGSSHQHIPWWMIVVAVCCAAVILLLLVLLLHMVGFFERRKSPTTKDTAAITDRQTNGRHSYNGYQPVAYEPSNS